MEAEGKLVEYDVMAKNKEDDVVAKTKEDDVMADEKDVMGSRVSGVIKWYNHKRAYGFISGGKGEDFFVHLTNFKQHNRGRIVRAGRFVEFDPVRSQFGLRALNVKVLDGQPSQRNPAIANSTKPQNIAPYNNEGATKEIPIRVNPFVENVRTPSLKRHSEQDRNGRITSNDDCNVGSSTLQEKQCSRPCHDGYEKDIVRFKGGCILFSKPFCSSGSSEETGQTREDDPQLEDYAERSGHFYQGKNSSQGGGPIRGNLFMESITTTPLQRSSVSNEDIAKCSIHNDKQDFNGDMASLENRESERITSPKNQDSLTRHDIDDTQPLRSLRGGRSTRGRGCAQIRTAGIPSMYPLNLFSSHSSEKTDSYEGAPSGAATLANASVENLRLKTLQPDAVTSENVASCNYGYDKQETNGTITSQENCKNESITSPKSQGSLTRHDVNDFYDAQPLRSLRGGRSMRGRGCGQLQNASIPSMYPLNFHVCSSRSTEKTGSNEGSTGGAPNQGNPSMENLGMKTIQRNSVTSDNFARCNSGNDKQDTNGSITSRENCKNENITSPRSQGTVPGCDGTGSDDAQPLRSLRGGRSMRGRGGAQMRNARIPSMYPLIVHVCSSRSTEKTGSNEGSRSGAPTRGNPSMEDLRMKTIQRNSVTSENVARCNSGNEKCKNENITSPRSQGTFQRCDGNGIDDAQPLRSLRGGRSMHGRGCAQMRNESIPSMYPLKFHVCSSRSTEKTGSNEGSTGGAPNQGNPSMENLGMKTIQRNSVPSENVARCNSGTENCKNENITSPRSQGTVPGCDGNGSDDAQPLRSLRGGRSMRGRGGAQMRNASIPSMYPLNVHVCSSRSTEKTGSNEGSRSGAPTRRNPSMEDLGMKTIQCNSVTSDNVARCNSGNENCKNDNSTPPRSQGTVPGCDGSGSDDAQPLRSLRGGRSMRGRGGAQMRNSSIPFMYPLNVHLCSSRSTEKTGSNEGSRSGAKTRGNPSMEDLGMKTIQCNSVTSENVARCNSGNENCKNENSTPPRSQGTVPRCDCNGSDDTQPLRSLRGGRSMHGRGCAQMRNASIPSMYPLNVHVCSSSSTEKTGSNEGSRSGAPTRGNPSMEDLGMKTIQRNSVTSENVARCNSGTENCKNVNISPSKSQGTFQRCDGNGSDDAQPLRSLRGGRSMRGRGGAQMRNASIPSMYPLNVHVCSSRSTEKTVSNEGSRSGAPTRGNPSMEDLGMKTIQRNSVTSENVARCNSGNENCKNENSTPPRSQGTVPRCDCNGSDDTQPLRSLRGGRSMHGRGCAQMRNASIPSMYPLNVHVCSSRSTEKTGSNEGSRSGAPTRGNPSMEDLGMKTIQRNSVTSENFARCNSGNENCKNVNISPSKSQGTFQRCDGNGSDDAQPLRSLRGGRSMRGRGGAQMRNASIPSMYPLNVHVCSSHSTEKTGSNEGSRSGAPIRGNPSMEDLGMKTIQRNSVTSENVARCNSANDKQDTNGSITSRENCKNENIAPPRSQGTVPGCDGNGSDDAQPLRSLRGGRSMRGRGGAQMRNASIPSMYPLNVHVCSSRSTEKTGSNEGSRSGAPTCGNPSKEDLGMKTIQRNSVTSENVARCNSGNENCKNENSTPLRSQGTFPRCDCNGSDDTQPLRSLRGGRSMHGGGFPQMRNDEQDTNGGITSRENCKTVRITSPKNQASLPRHEGNNFDRVHPLRISREIRGVRGRGCSSGRSEKTSRAQKEDFHQYKHAKRGSSSHQKRKSSQSVTSEGPIRGNPFMENICTTPHQRVFISSGTTIMEDCKAAKKTSPKKQCVQPRHDGNDKDAVHPLRSYRRQRSMYGRGRAPVQNGGIPSTVLACSSNDKNSTGREEDSHQYKHAKREGNSHQKRKSLQDVTTEGPIHGNPFMENISTTPHQRVFISSENIVPCKSGQDKQDCNGGKTIEEGCITTRRKSPKKQCAQPQHDGNDKDDVHPLRSYRRQRSMHGRGRARMRNAYLPSTAHVCSSGNIEKTDKVPEEDLWQDKRSEGVGNSSQQKKTSLSCLLNNYEGVTTREPIHRSPLKGNTTITPLQPGFISIENVAPCSSVHDIQYANSGETSKDDCKTGHSTSPKKHCTEPLRVGDDNDGLHPLRSSRGGCNPFTNPFNLHVSSKGNSEKTITAREEDLQSCLSNIFEGTTSGELICGNPFKNNALCTSDHDNQDWNGGIASNEICKTDSSTPSKKQCVQLQHNGNDKNGLRLLWSRCVTSSDLRLNENGEENGGPTRGNPFVENIKMTTFQSVFISRENIAPCNFGHDEQDRKGGITNNEICEAESNTSPKKQCAQSRNDIVRPVQSSRGGCIQFSAPFCSSSSNENTNAAREEDLQLNKHGEENGRSSQENRSSQGAMSEEPVRGNPFVENISMTPVQCVFICSENIAPCNHKGGNEVSKAESSTPSKNQCVQLQHNGNDKDGLRLLWSRCVPSSDLRLNENGEENGGPSRGNPFVENIKMTTFQSVFISSENIAPCNSGHNKQDRQGGNEVSKAESSKSPRKQCVQPQHDGNDKDIVRPVQNSIDGCIHFSDSSFSSGSSEKTDAALEEDLQLNEHGEVKGNSSQEKNSSQGATNGGSIRGNPVMENMSKTSLQRDSIGNEDIAKCSICNDMQDINGDTTSNEDCICECGTTLKKVASTSQLDDNNSPDVKKATCSLLDAKEQFCVLDECCKNDHFDTATLRDLECDEDSGINGRGSPKEEGLKRSTGRCGHWDWLPVNRSSCEALQNHDVAQRRESSGDLATFLGNCCSDNFRR